MSTKKDVATRERGLSRRDFARRAALATAAIAALPSELLPAHSAVATESVLSPADEPRLSPESQAEADAKIQAIFRKYGNRLSEEQKTDIRRLVTEGQKSLEALRAYKLENSDQPGTALRLYPDFPPAEQHPSKRADPVRPAREE